MPSDYGYINARVKGIHSRLIPENRYLELLALPSLSSFAEALSGLGYGKEYQEALSRHTGLKAIEEALARNLQSTTRKILKMTEGKPKTLISIFLKQWDLYNLKTIVRGKHKQRPEEEILAQLLPAGELGELFLSELLRQPNLNAIADTLASWGHPFALPLTQQVENYEKSKDLSRLEFNLDHYYFQWGVEKSRGWSYSEREVRKLIQKEIDILNFKTALKLREEDLEFTQKVQYFLSGGREIPYAVFISLLDVRTLTKARYQLQGTFFSQFLKRSSTSELDEKISLLFNHFLCQLYRGDPLSVDVVIGFLYQKYNEIINLRLIARGKAFNIPAEKIQEELRLF
ncbi:MAG: V-type ATPase subunit [Candidatus Edwardsbacteria bacterium]